MKKIVYMQDLDLEGRMVTLLLDSRDGAMADGLVRRLRLRQRPEDGRLPDRTGKKLMALQAV
jgi:hypothetical protein